MAKKSASKKAARRVYPSTNGSASGLLGGGRSSAFRETNGRPTTSDASNSYRSDYMSRPPAPSKRSRSATRGSNNTRIKSPTGQLRRNKKLDRPSSSEAHKSNASGIVRGGGNGRRRRRKGAKPSLVVHWGDLRRYRLGEELGQGTFGKVVIGQHIRTRKTVAIKGMKVEQHERMRTKKEINTLLRVHNGPNIIRLYDTVRNKKNINHLVFEYVREDNFRDLYSELDDNEIRYYMYKLFAALQYSHERRVIHRDIKPHNIAIDHRQKKLRLIDWGCAGLWAPGKKFRRFPGTKPYKAPEMLLLNKRYGPAVDIWGAGIVLATMMFKMVPFFPHLKTDLEQLRLMVRVLGTDDFYKYLYKYNVPAPKHFLAHKIKHHKRPWESFVNKTNRATVTEEGLALLNRCLDFDPHSRITAEQALAHEFFDPVRDEAQDFAYGDPAEFGIGIDTEGKASDCSYTTDSSSSEEEDEEATGFLHVSSHDSSSAASKSKSRARSRDRSRSRERSAWSARSNATRASSTEGSSSSSSKLFS